MIKCETEMREGVEVTGKKKGNPNYLNLVLFSLEIKSTPLYGSSFYFSDIKHKNMLHC